MNYVGVDIHKKYSVLCALDESGRKLREGRVEGNSARGFAQFFASLQGPSKAVVEACWNWGLIHDELEELEASGRGGAGSSLQDALDCRCADQNRAARRVCVRDCLERPHGVAGATPASAKSH